MSNETKKCTSFGQPIRNNQVNLERAVTPSTRLGGHLVSGHVDGLGTLVKREDNDNESILWISSPAELVKYIAVKGSICINGVSLTVNQCQRRPTLRYNYSAYFETYHYRLYSSSGFSKHRSGFNRTLHRAVISRNNIKYKR